MVAERAGVSTAALHYHFDTRENLFAEALRYSFEHTGADVYEANGNNDTATARLARIISGVAAADTSLRREWAMWQELWCRAGRDPESRTLAIELYRAHSGWIEETLADGSLPASSPPATRRRTRSWSARLRRVRRAADVREPACHRRGLPRSRSGRTRQPARHHLRSPETAADRRPATPVFRRGFLSGSAGAAMLAAAPGCAYIEPANRSGGPRKPDRAQDRWRPRLLQLGRLRRPDGLRRASSASTA